MELDIKQILSGASEQLPFEGSLDLSDIKWHGDVLFPQLLAVKGEVTNRAGVVVLRYQITGVMPYKCDRCLMQCRKDIDSEFSHTVVNELQDEELDDIYLVCPEGIIELEEIATSDLLLSLPSKLLCREDCKGLCSECGANLNEGDCGCSKKAVDPRLQKLADLLKG